MMGDSRQRMVGIAKSSREKAATTLAEKKTHDAELNGRADENLQGYANAVGPVKGMAKDKMFGSTETTAYLQEALHPLIEAQVKTASDLQQVHAECVDSLNVETAHLQRNVAQVLDEDGFTSTDLRLEENLTRLASDAVRQPLAASMNAATASLEGRWKQCSSVRPPG